MITIKEHNAILLEFKVRNKHLQKELERTEKENKRYREEIKKAVGEFNYDEHYQGMSILLKALEGEAQ